MTPTTPAALPRTSEVSLAPREAWPLVLRSPPWRREWRPDLLEPGLQVAPIPTPFDYGPAVAFPDSIHARRRDRAIVLRSLDDLPAVIAEMEAAGSGRASSLPAGPIPAPGDAGTAVLAWLDRRLTEIESAGGHAFYGSPYTRLAYGMELQPPALALLLWAHDGLQIKSYDSMDDATVPMLSRFGAAVVPGILRVIRLDPLRGLSRFAGVDAADIAPIAAGLLQGTDALREVALAWLRRHRRTAVTRLIPQAIGEPGPAREAAGFALRLLRRDGPGAEADVAEIADAYAAVDLRVHDAVAGRMGRDPLLDVPDEVRPLPAWFAPAAWSRPVLRGGAALPEDAMTAIGEMLSFAKRRDLYAGIGALRDACTPDSLDRFALSLFSAWMARGGPGQTNWAVRAVGWLGGDDCARHIAPVIRRWLDKKARPQAAMGLEALVDIGSEVALVQLAEMAERLPSTSLRAKAARHLRELAESRGMTADELADRIAPDLGLDARGGLDLDFGPRRFRAGFDEFLRPVVRDASGMRLRDLPKIRKSDDAICATAAAARWSALKRDARATVAVQILRLERMLATARRVDPGSFRTCFAEHRLIRHLAARLVWGVYDESGPAHHPQATFRIGEDFGLVTAAGDASATDLSSEPGKSIGLVHPLVMGMADLAAWAAALGDFEIAQPFPQIHRATHALASAEMATTSLSRFRGARIGAGWLRGSVPGWRLGPAEEDALIVTLAREVIFRDGARGRATLQVRPGIRVGTPEPGEGLQELGTLDLAGPIAEDHRVFGDLDPVTASEMLYGIAALVARG